MPADDTTDQNLLAPKVKTPDQHVEKSVMDTFPASDPVGTNDTAGARAAPPSEMLTHHNQEPLPDGLRLSFGFPDRETAKLAMEQAVRAGEVEDSRAQLDTDGGEAMLHVEVTPSSADRVKDLLIKAGGHEH
ncbi:hypothetical protein [Roseomonas elaeocarpi]|uniref:SPOR domain-containing protein n=1 Tax=Roseomonas elaeocarpi TaxID=907779 RepID=A0ABV6JUG1_9PROT